MSEALSSNNRRPKKKQNSGIAYILPLRAHDLKVKYSANAWWMDRTKIPQLLAAFSIGATIQEACAHIHITLRQYKYFVSLHPEFSEERELSRANLGIKAKLTIARAIEYGEDKQSVRLAMWYLSKHEPEVYGRPSRRKARRQQKLDQLERQEDDKLRAHPLGESLIKMKKLREEYRKRAREILKEERQKSSA